MYISQTFFCHLQIYIFVFDFLLFVKYNRHIITKITEDLIKLPTVCFESGAELQASLVEKTNIFCKGQARDILEIHCNDANIAFNDLKNFSFSNLGSGEIIIKDNGEEFLYTNYEIFHSLQFINNEYVLTIAQLSQDEIKYNDLLKRIEALEK